MMKRIRHTLSTASTLGLLICTIAIANAHYGKKSNILDSQAQLLRADLRELNRRTEALKEIEINSSLPNEIVWSATDQSSAEFALQQLVINTTSDIGISLDNFVTSSINLDIVNPTMALDVEFYANLNLVYQLFAALEHSRPRVALKDVNLRATSGYGQSEENVYVRLKVWSFWLSPEAIQ